MRRILIDSYLEAKATEFAENLFKGKTKGFKTPIENLKKLRDSLQPIKHKNQKIYVQKILDKYNEILKASPDQMKNLISEFDVLSKNGILEKGLKPKDKLKFYELIVGAMRYDELRNSEFHHFVKESGIKTCVYCNSQMAIIADFSYYDKKEKKRKKKIMAKFELDHYHSKSKYPFLCTSFYNLYPVCGNCNRAKSDNPIDFELYTVDPNKIELFKFWIDDKSIIEYWLESVPKNSIFKIHFEEINGNYSFFNEYNNMFAIQGVYDTQKDLAEELVYKAKVYTRVYKDSLVDNFKVLFPDKKTLEKLIIGNYVDSNDIYRRPMAKYSQDLAKQLGLI